MSASASSRQGSTFSIQFCAERDSAAKLRFSTPGTRRTPFSIGDKGIFEVAVKHRYDFGTAAAMRSAGARHCRCDGRRAQDAAARGQRTARSTCPKTRSSSERHCRRSSRRPRSSTARSSPRPTSTSGWRCSRSPTAARSRPRKSSGCAQQVLRNLIDETLQIQAATAEEIEITDADIDKTVARVAGNVKQTPEQMADYLKASGSSIRSIRRQIRGRNRLAPASVRRRSRRRQRRRRRGAGGHRQAERVQGHRGISRRRNLPRPPTAAIDAEVQANAQPDLRAAAAGRLVRRLCPPIFAKPRPPRSAAISAGSAPSSCPSRSPLPFAQMRPGQVSNPIAVPGGFSIVAVQDTRKILTADPRDAVLSLKQMSITFPRARPGSRPSRRSCALRRGRAECRRLRRRRARSPPTFNGEVVADRPGQGARPAAGAAGDAAADQVGQATPPFGSIEEGSASWSCAAATRSIRRAPTFDQVYAQLNEERVNLRARRYLRDLRRDAVIDYR